ncbi:UDP-N-acetylglucosamine--undecaprenyl-phosphate N-acetylglucosaminephosphotransferase [Photobacterium sp. WH77]|uniref:UDP-N-acetylglucosamine--undecaprenyl-phosphate N-acetylglucosaminephosphotransferase n=1 Tax=unclassified Photobacterium TaxID=2628852 RepID=UPI001EDC6E4E|nr:MULTISPECIES: UDP-N-acetylglucosamine--undecaprenyl-phosphate N-acetylglucosaminephosphotransferase [unclassified Photobacterium]MCG2835709.1 UDP-N-acetylglucosamine--undecaprenyl-phosphate N-acetylglucosaminephosphotransferase [Photobacterium sp. WH77]MCG2843322.1 UDP-N-acetylglucosamine--undecaprenyl-phosphate N-acetylglucosaminephosphotransferase [Photobacterium sp. WH80]
MTSAFFFVFLMSFCSLFICRKVAKRVGLVDAPNERKHHKGVIPLVGGVSIFVTLAIAFSFFELFPQNPWLYLSCATVLVVIGVIDDRYDISFKLRLLVQACVSLVMIFAGDKSLHYLGYMLGDFPLALPVVASTLLTVFAVIGAINAFNMVDGIDGLLGGLASVSFAALGYVFYVSGNTELFVICAMIVTAMVPYILLNLGFPLGRRFKVFMGDAGSIFIGFTVIWLLLEATQAGELSAMRPVTALWLIALPLMDMATIMIRRIRKGQSPFKPDREHLHHICQRIGLSPFMTLVVICGLAASMAGVGIWSDMSQVNETLMLLSFMIMFGVYFAVISHIWRITTWIHKLTGRSQPKTPEQATSER